MNNDFSLISSEQQLCMELNYINKLKYFIHIPHFNEKTSQFDSMDLKYFYVEKGILGINVYVYVYVLYETT